MQAYEQSSTHRKGEKKEKKKKKKKSKRAEGEGISADSHDGEHHASSPRTDEEGEEKRPKKRKAKKKHKEDRESSSQKSKTEEAGVAEAKMLGGNADGKHRKSGQHKRADDDAEMNTRKPASRSSRQQGNQESPHKIRTNTIG